MAELLAATLFVFGYAAISMEHRLFVNKAATSMLLAVALWLLASFYLPLPDLTEHLSEAGSSIFSIVVFLISAMTLVEILLHYHLFDVIESKLRSKGLNEYHMALCLAFITYVLSSFLPNLTTVIVAIQISRRLFKEQDLLRVGALIVIASNAGGGFSPIGDVNTLMLWFAHKFTAWQVISQGFLPSLLLLGASAFILLAPLKGKALPASECTLITTLSRSDRAIIIASIGAFFLPLMASMFHLPAYMGLLAGLGFVWILIDIAKKVRPQATHLQANIKKFLQYSDIESIQFFLGILLAVAALDSLGVLQKLTNMILGLNPDFFQVVTAFVGLGLASSIVDNVPITAAAINAIQDIAPDLWALLALSVTNGGSLFIIGSASGVVAMGMLPKLTFGRYMKLATIPVIIGFAVAIGTWLLQYSIINT